MIKDKETLQHVDEIQKQIENCEIEPEMSSLDWAMYEFATIEYDYRIHPHAARRIEKLFENIYKDSKE